MSFEPVIGLEVHVQLATRTKAFCSCAYRYGAEPNTLVCPVCLALPGALPVLQQEAVNLAIKVGLAFDFTIHQESIFARKNYFYPDLPKGYQISQYDRPICTEGNIPIELENGTTKNIRVERAHMEEDTGKSIHGDTHSLLDLNRAGVPLVEIVSGPDMRNPQEAYLYLTRLKSTLLYAGVTSGSMEEGAMRVDANISLRPTGQKKFGTRNEVKNINSFRNVVRALDYEISRQGKVLADGGKIHQETRLFNDATGETKVMRSKETESDYRYFPEPDLPALLVSEDLIESIRKTMPELPRKKKLRYLDELLLPEDQAELLAVDPETSQFFENVISFKAPAKQAANWILTELNRVLNEAKLSPSKSPISPKHLAELVVLIEDGTISGKMAKQVFAKMVEQDKAPSELVDDLGLKQISDPEKIGILVDEVIAANPAQAQQYRDGKTKVFGFFVGQMMKKSKGQANPGVVNQVLKEKLEA